MQQVITLMQKEWADVFRNRYVLYIVFLLPLLMVGLPVAVLGFGANADTISGADNDIPPQLLEMPPYNELPEVEAIQAFIGQQFNLFFLILPLAIPMTIATYSIVGEKRERSLEPLLATPISTVQLLAGKALAAAGPGILVVWISAVLYTILLQLVIPSAAVRGIILSGTFFILITVIAPLLTVLATITGLMVSSRVNDPRAAEQLGMVVLLPILLLFFAQVAGLVIFNEQLAWIMAAIIVAVDGLLLGLAVRLFARETILTRWK